MARNAAEPVQALPHVGQAPLDAMLFDTVLRYEPDTQKGQAC